MTASGRPRLETHWPCFEGIVPAVIVTAARDGAPNVSHISHVFYIDENHVALSNQFMSKMLRNLSENPRLQVVVGHPETGHQLVLDLIYQRAETSGPVFDHLAASVTAVAAHFGMDKVMRLRSADIYRVLDFTCERVDGVVLSDVLPPRRDALTGAIPLSLSLSRLDDLDQAIDATLDGLHGALGLSHCIVFLADPDRRMLTAIASRGYDWQGAGAEVRWGEGVVGMAAERRQILRLGCVGRQFLYMNGVRRAGQLAPDPLRQIPMPGLDAPQSLLAVPMIFGGEVRGLIFAESVSRLAFSPGDAKAVELVAAQLGALVALLGSNRDHDGAEAMSAAANRLAPLGQSVIRAQHYAYDDSVFINQDYVIKGVPGRLLWRMLRDHERDGRTDFTNREFRLDPSLKLPEFKDNLETRLLLLARRLAEKSWPIRVERSGRGRMTLFVYGSLVMSEHD